MITESMDFRESVACAFKEDILSGKHILRFLFKYVKIKNCCNKSAFQNVL